VPTGFGRAPRSNFSFATTSNEMNQFEGASLAASSRDCDATLWFIAARLSSTGSFSGSLTIEPVGKTFPAWAPTGDVHGHTLPQLARRKDRQRSDRLIHASFPSARGWHWIWFNRAHSPQESQ
jgi:hypothetical protein